MQVSGVLEVESKDRCFPAVRHMLDDSGVAVRMSSSVYTYRRLYWACYIGLATDSGSDRQELTSYGRGEVDEQVATVLVSLASPENLLHLS